MKFWNKSIWVFFIVFSLAFVFLNNQLGKWDHFLYRPGSQYSDLTITFWPNITYFQDSLNRFHQLPLWRNQIFAGSPIDGDPQSGLWYPPNLIFLIFPATFGLNFLFLMHILAGGMGMYAWCRTTGISCSGAFLASNAFAFCPKLIAHLGFGHVGLYYGAVYIPWVFWAILQASQGSRRHFAFLSIILGLQIIANPQVAFYTGLVGVGYVVLNSWIDKLKFREMLKREAMLFSGYFWALVISAVQTIPMIRLASISGRQGMDFADAAISSLPFRYLLGLVVADHRGYMEYMLYAGIGVFMLALFSINMAHGRNGWIVFIVGIGYALGTNLPIFSVVYKFLPFLEWLRSPARIMLVAFAFLALCAGLGFDRLKKEFDKETKKRLNLILAGFAFFALITVLGYQFLIGHTPLNLVAFGILLPIFGLVIALGVNKQVGEKALIGILTTLILIDLWWVDSSFIEGRSKEEVFQQHELAAYLEEQRGKELFRVYSPSYSLPRQTVALYGLETADGVDPLYLDDYDHYMQAASGVERSHYEVTIPSLEGAPPESANRDAIPDPSLLGRLNVRYIAAEFPIKRAGFLELGKYGSTYLYLNEQYLPRAFFASGIITVGSVSEALEILKIQSDMRITTIENFITQINSPLESSMIEWMKQTSNELIITSNVDRPALLVISQAYHKDWVAYIDQVPSQIYKCDGVLTCVMVNPGKHEVVLKYQPVFTYLGMMISSIALLVAMWYTTNKPDRI